MNDAARMGVFQCGGDLRGNLPGLVERQRAARGSALYVLHHQVSEAARRFADIVDVADVGVV